MHEVVGLHCTFFLHKVIPYTCRAQLLLLRPSNGTLTYNNKKRHEGMYSCPFVFRYRQTPCGKRGLGKHISRLKICYRDIAYTLKRKHKCSVPLLKFADLIDKDSIAMLFLLTAFALESKCKNTKCFQTGKIINGNSRSFTVIRVE